MTNTHNYTPLLIRETCSEERIPSIHEPASHRQGMNSYQVNGGAEIRPEKVEELRRLFFGLDFRHPMGFNLGVLKALLAARYRRLVSSNSG